MAAQRAADRAGQLRHPANRATVPAQSSPSQSLPARAVPSQPCAPAAEPASPAGPVLGPPHPEMLLSARAEQVLARPLDDSLQPSTVSKTLQTAHATIVKRRLRVDTVAELNAVFHRPPDWLLDFHRKLAAERAANRLKQAGRA